MLEGLIGDRVFLEEYVYLVMGIISLFDPSRDKCCSWIGRGYERNDRYGIILCVRDSKLDESMLVIAEIRENRCGVGVKLDV